jgi:uncharacterized membrane protein
MRKSERGVAAMPWVRGLLARPRLVFSAVFGALVALALPDSLGLHAVTRFIIGWNAGAWVYLILALHLMFRSSHASMRSRAIAEDDGRTLVLTLVVLAAIVCLGTIFAQLAVAKSLPEPARNAHIALSVLTVVSSWAFTQVMFAMHYAHVFYAAEAAGSPGGLDFPGETRPDYADFLYFAAIIGTSAQTADIGLSSRTMRRVGLVHCVLAFFFNATLLALTINIVSGLI